MHFRTDRRGQVELLDTDPVLPVGQRKLQKRRRNGLHQIPVQSWRGHPIFRRLQDARRQFDFPLQE